MYRASFLTKLSGRRAILGLVVALLAVIPAAVILAQPTIPEDPLATISADWPDGTFVRFGFGEIPPLPADYFGPGSDPFDGIIALAGDPLDPPQHGDAATLVLRSEQPVPPSAPPGYVGMVDVEIVAMDLVSAQPIIVTYNGGLDPEPWNVRVLLSPTTPPPGQLFATKTHPNGGTFDMYFLVQPRFVFTRVSDGLERDLDTGMIGMPPLNFQTFAAPWVHTMYPGLGFLAPSDGWFVPSIEEQVPGIPESQLAVPTVASEVSGAAQHVVFPPRPPAPPDPLATISGLEPDGTFVWFGFGAIPPLPADYFGPGSDPFEGQVALGGNPLDPPPLGDASTLAQRTGQPLAPSDPPGSVAEVPIEIVALDLVSVEPIVVTYTGGLDPEPWDVRVLLSPTTPPAGRLIATKTHDNGGWFESFFDVQLVFVFTRIPDGEQRFLDTAAIGLPPLMFSMADGPWVHHLNPMLDVLAPSDGWFVPGVEEVVPNNPSSQQLHRMVAQEMSGAARHTVFPARPIGTEVAEKPLNSLAVRGYPNPFNPSLGIEFTLPQAGDVEIGIYSLTGGLVKRLVAGVFEPGTHTIRWDGTDLHGGPAASGVYIYRVSAADRAAVGKVMLVR